MKRFFLSAMLMAGGLAWSGCDEKSAHHRADPDLRQLREHPRTIFNGVRAVAGASVPQRSRTCCRPGLVLLEGRSTQLVGVPVQPAGATRSSGRF